ncbi:hypothetical protein XBJ2_1550062 [Xenorhabdus bovienii str. Jollieti]|uniref:Uncharacterized protein n=1 Tax=Xenorhabdus bovienii (strain SS-2004) TaxID=406818 RepID=D3V853_XENBS|nr:hypothetical protein XBJ1_2891 [Xenorhabdus bovienii SS-2004]CDH27841.1 hypothetical protein XBJ2_1550062 [Xenorhabdus bovienii str. Jollieti]
MLSINIDNGLLRVMRYLFKTKVNFGGSQINWGEHYSKIYGKE